MTKYVISNKIKIIFILIFILVIVPSVILAYRPPPSEICARFQRRVNNDTEFFISDSNHSFQSTTPEERFKELCSLLLEKKYVKEPYSFRKDCSYGLIISDVGEPMVYCKYHGNAKNADTFSHMSFAKYYASKKSSSYYLVVIVCFVLSSFIYFMKSACKKLINNEEEKDKDKGNVYDD